MARYVSGTVAAAAGGAVTYACQTRNAGMIISVRERLALRASLCGAVSATAVAAALLWPGSAAYAACLPAATPGAPNGQTVTCSGSTNNGNAGGTGYGIDVTHNSVSLAPNNNTINIQLGASVTGDNFGFGLGTGNTINNTNGGTIAATNGGAVGFASGIIAAAAAPATLTVNNNGKILGSSTAANAQAFGISAGPITLSNSGNISSTVPDGASQSIAVFGTAITMSNNGGTITASGNSQNGTMGVFAINALTINANTGSITGADDGVLSGGATMVTNNNGGTITGTNMVGVLVNGGSSNVIITNGGMISGGKNGINTNTTGTTTISNTATIMGTNGGATPGAIRVNTASINNSGTVSGDFAIFFRDGNGASTIFNSGSLTGTSGTAIHFSVGSIGNTLTLAPGFGISGTVAGAGSDILQLGGTGSGTFNASNIGASQQYQGFTTFNKIDVSTWTLTGTGATNQNWNITGGTLTGDTNSIQSTTVAISNNALLDFNQSFNGAFAGSITGTGALQKDGAGTVILTGANSYSGSTTISAGTLQLGNGGTSGTLGTSAGTITDNGTLAFDRSDTVTFGNAISGTGGLSQIGAGTLILTGASNYSGPTNVNAGLLSVTGSLTSTVNVNSTGILTGTGTVGAIQVMNGGTLQPGAPGTLGTLNVSGNVTFQPGSTYQVRTTAAGQNDALAVTGTTKINGGAVLALSQNGSYALQTNYTIITSNGGVSGQFAGVTDSLTFLSPSLTYNADSVVLTLMKVANFTTVATTPNQLAVAKALDQGPLTNPLILALLNTNTAGAQQALDALSGEVFASLQSALFGGSFVLRLEVLERLREAGYFGAPGPLGALALGYQDVVPGDAALGDVVAGDADAGTALGYAKAKGVPVPLKAPPKAAADNGLSFWAHGIGGFGHTDSDGNAAALDSSFSGFVAGIDKRLSGVARLGVAGAYTHTSVDVGARASSAGIDSGHIAGYAGFDLGVFNLRTGGIYSFHTIDTTRTVAFPGFFDHDLGHFNGSTGQVFGEVGHGFALGQLAVEPFAGLAWVGVRTNGFLENGGLAALNVGSTNDNVGYSSLGARAASIIPLAGGQALVPRASVAWQHAFDNVTPAAAVAFQSTGAAFSIAGVPIARDAAEVEGGLDLRLTPSAKVTAGYTGELSPSTQTHAIKGGFTWNF